jgi:glyoxylase-like metal-dependent hydrolase (beta-lactamase superfamily II)
LPLVVVQSHAHWDHIGSTHQFAAESDILIHPEAADELRAGVSNQRMRDYLAPEHFTGPFAGSRAGDSAEIPGVEPTGFLAHDQVIDLGGRSLRVLDAPGHTAGQVMLWDEANRILFGTDAVYAGPLYAQMDDSDLPAYARTLDRLISLEPAPRVVYSAHCDAPMDPALIPLMRDAVDEVLAGRALDRRTDDEAVHEFAGFSILVPLPPPLEGQA